MINKDELKTFAITAQLEISNGSTEDKLRHFLSNSLIKIFPDSPWWIQEHVMGTETYLHFSNSEGKERVGFADSVVGKTAIEYERNLTISSIFNEGFYQVKEYCAALCNLGIKENDILGILSDTVRWYGYSIAIVGNHGRTRLFGPEDIQLKLNDYVDLSQVTNTEFDKFECFVDKYLGREQSRILTAKTLVLDFGLESEFYYKEIEFFKKTVTQAMDSNPDYAELIKTVWQNFIAYLGASEYGSFSLDTYTNEFYLVTVAKLICANILNGSPLVCNDSEIKKILNGKYFLRENIQNLVDYDYFGWLNNEPYASEIIGSVKRLQKLLCSYDFNTIGEDDLFGALLAQLSNREHRLLLGQDYTPHWVAKDMIDYTFDNLNEPPRMLDMCCGSGVFLIEAIKKVREKYDINIANYNAFKDECVFSCVMGFDIDPLAVMLAKVNWVMTMRDLFPYHTGHITIPVYHADSLFVATPITHNMPTHDNDSYLLFFDNNKVSIPSKLLTPSNRSTFDAFMSTCYEYAMERARGIEKPLTDIQLELVMSSIEEESGVTPNTADKDEQKTSARKLILQLEKMQRNGRNGIWHFILNNSYRPGLVSNQFNCIVSNPPWLAMSKLADNPYKNTLQDKTGLFGIKPPGASHLHIELATTFLLAAIDKYLENNGRWMCVMPGSIMSGYHHEPLRLEQYRNSPHSIATNIDTLWELPITTFKNKAIVLGGEKTNMPSDYPLQGREYEDLNTIKHCNYYLKKQGNRSAWTNKDDGAELLDVLNNNPWPFNQGADIMPRTALFHKFRQLPNGTWTIKKIEKKSELYYLISDSHRDTCKNLEAEGFSNDYMYYCYISKHLSPFILSKPANVLIPAKKISGIWKGITAGEFAVMNPGTKYVFNEIQNESGESLLKLFDDKINIRRKLDNQKFSLGKWLVLSNAGGTNPCAAVLDLDGLDRTRLIIDQTLYWYLAESEDEALYITGLLNSETLSKAISDFQPQGGFGARHIHTIPYKIIPRFDEQNDGHLEVVSITKKLINEWEDCCTLDSVGKYINPSSGSLNSRRRKLQTALKQLPSYSEYERTCGNVLCVGND